MATSTVAMLARRAEARDALGTAGRIALAKPKALHERPVDRPQI